jgi:hypothetical protein
MLSHEATILVERRSLHSAGRDRDMYCIEGDFRHTSFAVLDTSSNLRECARSCLTWACHGDQK